MDQQELKLILADHQLWLSHSGKLGKRARLQAAELKWANLRGADLRRADLRGANLKEAKLRASKLQGAELQGVNLQLADLQAADLSEANLLGANLSGANLQGAELQKANLREADLQDANLLRANLFEAKLDGSIYEDKQLGEALNVSPKYLSDATTESTDVYQRRAEDAQSKVTILEQEKRELESKLKAAEQDGAQSDMLKQSLEAAKVDLDQARNQLEQNKQKRAVLDELTGAIKPLLDAVKSDKNTVRVYKLQSWCLLLLGIICFVIATVFISYKAIQSWQLPLPTQAISVAQLLLQIAPGFVFAILGTALLRHDWKIRQLTLKLIDQNNSVDIAMGMLTTALRLSNIGEKKDIEGIPDLVKESFVEVRRALLYRNRSDAPAPADDSGKDAAELIKQLKSLIPKSPSAGSTNPPSS